jgi:nucleoside-diphosphate-sugar epimerase
MSIASPVRPPTAPLLKDVAAVEEALSRPTPGLAQALAALDGDLMILGVGGKMGPTLARMARRALDEAGSRRSVYGVARFTQPEVRGELESAGVRAVPCDLLDRAAVSDLPDAPNVIFMAGMKFGSTGAEALTWAMNAVVPSLVAERYRDARIVVFSSGNIYPIASVLRGGSTETSGTGPVGEYAQSALARERVFEHFSRRSGTRVVIFRLNYAIDLRYGILLDVAQQVAAGTPIDLTMGNVNVIWQGDANAIALRCLSHAQSPPLVLNVTGPETVSIRHLALRFGELLDRVPILIGEEAPTALLSNAAQCFRLFGYPTVPLEQMIRWVADWVRHGGATLNKPTHYETRDGKF